MKLRNFNVSESLGSPEMIREYLQQVIADGDMAELTRAIGHVAKANGMTELADKTGIGRESLYRSLSGEVSPRVDTLARVLAAYDLRLDIAPI